MPISMQGAWFVKVKSKSASFTQRFIISGAGSADGIYNGVTTTPEVLVDNPAWNITIQHNPGSGFLNSTMKLKNPQIIGGEYIFDLQSNDTGGDEDFNDLILSFRTPVTDQDYIVYGNISYYKGCLINPCYRIIVIDTRLKLREALRNSSIREAIKQYYPSLVEKVGFNPQPDLPGDPFTPIMVPFGGPAIPEKEEVLTVSKADKISIKEDKKKKQKAQSLAFNALKSAETRVSSQLAFSNESLVTDRNRFIDAAKILDRYRLNCETGPIPHALLKFEEYDRTIAELSGGSYTGEGTRENLGTINADFLGNYIFRFKRNTNDVVGEVANDVGAGENAQVQSRPDLIMTLLDQFETNTGLFETAPYWNIPFLRRINLCIPKEKSGVIPSACTGNHILQGVGNVAFAAEVGGNRVGFNNYLNSNGIITAFDFLAPGVRCAAWNGNLKLRGCLKNPTIKYYTLEYRKGFGAWHPFNQTLRLPRIIGSLNISALVNRTFGPAGSPIDGYLNVETDSGLWLEAFENIKANIRTSAFDNGRHEFRIQGYKADGTKFVSAKEDITLYLHNALTKLEIDENVTMGGATLGNCALFTLPVDGDGATIENAPMTIRFKVEHNPVSSPFGFINNYAMSMTKGATGGFGLNVPVVDANFVSAGVLDGVVNRGRNYVHIDNLNCNTRFKGTVNEVSADADGFYTVTVQPASGQWLASDQNFCAFGIHLGGKLRLTDGASGYPHFHATSVLIGIERPQP